MDESTKIRDAAQAGTNLHSNSSHVPALGQKRVQASDRFVAKRIEEIAAIWLNCNGNYRHIGVGR